MRVILFLCLILLGTVHASWGAEIAILVASDIPAYSKATLGIKQSLSVGTTIHEYNMKGDILKGQEMARTIRALNPDLVVVIGLKAALVAKVEILDPPIVFCMIISPSHYGIPTSNMTGVLMNTPSSHQLKSMKTVIPSLHRLGVLYNENHSGSFVAVARQHADRFHIELKAIHVSSDQDLPAALRQLVKEVDALWLIRDQTVVNAESLEFIMEMAIDHNLPVFGFSSSLMRYGALGAFPADFREMGRQAGRLARDILRGRHRLGSLPRPASPQYPQLALNLNAARFLGLTLPDQALQLASDLFGGPGAFAEVGQTEGKDQPSHSFFFQ